LGEKEADVIGDLAIPLPVKVIARLLGIAGDDYLAFKRWSDSLLEMNTSELEPGSRMRNGLCESAVGCVFV
jgi:cytochrome P450